MKTQLAVKDICNNLIAQLEMDTYTVEIWYKVCFKIRQKEKFELTIFYKVGREESNFTLYLETQIENLSEVYIYKLVKNNIETRIK